MGLVRTAGIAPARVLLAKRVAHWLPKPARLLISPRPSNMLCFVKGDALMRHFNRQNAIANANRDDGLAARICNVDGHVAISPL